MTTIIFNEKTRKFELWAKDCEGVWSFIFDYTTKAQAEKASREFDPY